MANVIKCNDADVAMRVSDSFALIESTCKTTSVYACRHVHYLFLAGRVIDLSYKKQTSTFL